MPTDPPTIPIKPPPTIPTDPPTIPIKPPLTMPITQDLPIIQDHPMPVTLEDALVTMDACPDTVKIIN
jgi:hypothetical protein